ncbi:hypothetical protein B0T49_21390 [Chromobacterium violaceum]|uniref:hypothetical protein n=1 Tax=Chromobacterium violaceum TaxID=536 RepID=UPI0009DA8378|nr:hypothetical protein [Chromobacterium violaceum]OQS45550.1 hypothetical protein B0T49_21390 [Chromobacterium violaceum]OQS47822.1 hypothetical protein B0T48_12120 [Chromobacterium violaceum]
MSKRLRLIYDLDAIAFRVCAGAEKDIYWGDGLWSVFSEEEDIKKGLKTVLEAHKNAVLKHFTKKQFKEAELVFVLSEGDNWRIKFDPTYKSNRRKETKINRKPVGYQWLIEYCKEIELPIKSEDGLEGDDVAGILATSDLDEFENVIVALDKDFKTVPCKFIRLTDNSLFDISPDDAYRNLMMQTLAGDVSDGYPGCPGIGEKKAREILEDCKTTSEMEFAAIKEFSKVAFKQLNEGVSLRYFMKEGFEEKTKEAMKIGEELFEKQYYLARILKKGDLIPQC